MGGPSGPTLWARIAKIGTKASGLKALPQKPCNLLSGL
ncbi:DUF6053 domain-containing protein [Lysobacter sp. CA199]